MKFETVVSGGCRSYLIGCEESCAAALIDPELSQIDRYLGLAATRGGVSGTCWTPTPTQIISRRRRSSRAGSACPWLSKRRPCPILPPAVTGRRTAGGRTDAPAGPAYSRPYPRFHVPVGRGPRVHRRHAAHRRNTGAPTSPPATPGPLMKVCSTAAETGSRAAGLSGARIQRPHPFHHRPGAGRNLRLQKRDRAEFIAMIKTSI